MIRRDTISLGLCALAVWLGVFAIGGATRWAQASVAIVAASALAATATSRRGFGRYAPLLVLIVAGIGWSVVQLLSLPSGIVSTLTPTLDALRADGASLAGVEPRPTLSMDPAATLRAVTFLLTLSALAIVALRLAISELGRYRLLACVAGAAGVAALVSGVHELLGVRKLYGLYAPNRLPPILGPLVNTNHLGCLMAVGAITSFGLTLYAKQSALLRIAWIANAAACIVVSLATYSRGAVIGLAVGGIVTLAALIAQRVYATELAASRRRRERFYVTTLPIGVTVVCALFVAVYLGGGSVVSQLQTTSLEELHAPRTKYAAWASSLQLLGDSPWVGVGRGAFESAFTRVHPASAYSTFTHPENEAVQAVVEWGLPASLVFAALAGWMILLAVRRWKDGPLAAGGLGALMAVAFQSNFDFGMELLGLAVPVIFVLATLTYVPLAELAANRARLVSAWRLSHVGCVLVGAAVLMTDGTRTLEEDHKVVRNQPSSSELLRSIETHPLDYYGYAALADRRFRANDPDAVRVLNHALRLHPTHSDLHWIAARLLVRAGRLSQAEAEYTTAVRFSISPPAVIAELVTVLPPERAARAIPLDMSIEGTLRHLRIDIAARWLERILEHSNNIRAAEALYTHGVRAKDWAMAERGARHRCRIMPSTRCTLELAKVLQRGGRHTEVVETLHNVHEWQGRREDQLIAWQMLCDAYVTLGNSADAASCARRLDASGLRP